MFWLLFVNSRLSNKSGEVKMIISFSLPFPLGSGSIYLSTLALSARKNFFVNKTKKYQARPRQVLLRRKTPATNGCFRGGRN